jgi:ketosteroid isomerase-like protein
VSEENLDLVRRQIQAFNDRDIPALESIFSEDFAYRLIGGFADLMGTEFRGRAAVAWLKSGPRQSTRERRLR